MDTNKRLMRYAILVVAILVITAIGYFVSIRIGKVNEAVSQYSVSNLDIGEPAAYVGMPQDANSTTWGDVTFTVIGRTVVGCDELSTLAPDYEDLVITEGGATDMKCVIVRAVFENNSDKVVMTNLSKLTAQEGIWHNGTDPYLFRELNPDVESLKLNPKERREVLVPFQAYDTQFGFNFADWETFGQNNLCIVLSAYPEKILIALNQRATYSGSITDVIKGSLE